MRIKTIFLFMSIAAILLPCVDALAFDSIVGKWKRGDGYIWIYDSGYVKASYDSNRNRSWRYASDKEYKYTGPDGEELEVTLGENGTVLRFSNGQTWRRVSGIESIVGRWKRGDGYISIYDSGYVDASYDNNTKRSWRHASGNQYHYIGPDGERLEVSLSKNGKVLSFSNGQTWMKVD